MDINLPIVPIVIVACISFTLLLEYDLFKRTKTVNAQFDDIAKLLASIKNRLDTGNIGVTSNTGVSEPTMVNAPHLPISRLRAEELPIDPAIVMSNVINDDDGNPFSMLLFIPEKNEFRWMLADKQTKAALKSNWWNGQKYKFAKIYHMMETDEIHASTSRSKPIKYDLSLAMHQAKYILDQVSGNTLSNGDTA